MKLNIFFWSENLASTKKWKIPCISSPPTMLQKLSKCEVKAWLCWNLIILPPLRFYVKSNFGELKRSKNVILANFRDSGLWILKLGKFGTLKLLKFTKKQNAKPLKWPKITFSERLNSPNVGFHVKSEWW